MISDIFRRYSLPKAPKEKKRGGKRIIKEKTKG